MGLAAAPDFSRQPKNLDDLSLISKYTSRPIEYLCIVGRQAVSDTVPSLGDVLQHDALRMRHCLLRQVQTLFRLGFAKLGSQLVGLVGDMCSATAHVRYGPKADVAQICRR